MSLFGIMRTSVSGMAAQANRLSSVADNIANSGTTGYKRSQIEFNTQVLDSSAGAYRSGSVGTTTRLNTTEQGNLKSTTSATDLAISGGGFFIVRDDADNTYMTRAGSFLVDSGGNLVNSAGHKLLGYDILNGAASPVVGGFSGLVPIEIGAQALKATATSEGVLVPNLPSNAPVVPPGSLPTDNVATSEFAGKTSLVTYDSLGNEKIIDVYFAKTATSNWEISAFDAADATNGSFPYSSGPIVATNVVFDPSTGYVVGGGATSISVPIPGGVTMELDLSGISQLGTDYQVLEAKTNGNSPSSIDRVEFDSDGTVYGIYDNGSTNSIYQLALAKVPSPNNLQALPGNAYSVSVNSGDVFVGAAESSGLGSIVANALEESNVDMGTELTIMIESQRSYTANSKVFQTGSDLMDVLVNLRR